MVTKAFAILTSAASTDDKCRNFGILIANKLRNYLSHTNNKVQNKISCIIFAANQVLFDVPYPVSTPSPASLVFSSITPSSTPGSEDVNLTDLMCL
jgi:hypothetical protein